MQLLLYTYYITLQDGLLYYSTQIAYRIYFIFYFMYS